MQSFRNDLEKVAPCLLRLIQTLRTPWLWFLKSSSQLKVFLHTWPSGSVWRSHFNDTVGGGDDIGLSSLFCPEGEEAPSGSDGDEGGEGCEATSTLPLSWTGVRSISVIAVVLHASHGKYDHIIYNSPAKMNIHTFVAKSLTFFAKSAIWFSENGGGGSKAVWNFSENSSVLVTPSVP